MKKDHKKIVQRLKEKGLDDDQARIAVGVLAELRQEAYEEGYNRGYKHAKEEK